MPYLPAYLRLSLVLLLLLFAPSAQAQSNSYRFPETGHTVSGRFLTYWQQHGGLAQQGYPTSEEFNEASDLNGQSYTVQYFERAVFEYHAENAGSQFEVLLSQLGTFQYRKKYPQGAPNQQASRDNPTKFAETGKTMGGKFRTYWEQHGGLAQQGYPISDEFTEISDLNGKPYLVQYFERAVFEYHPENAGSQFEVLLSQLGTYQLKQKYPTGPPVGEQVAKLAGLRLLGLSMVNQEDGWAVGDSGVILHYHDGQWRQAQSPTGRGLYAVQMLGGNEGWAVGEAGTILHYRNSQWQVVSSPTSESLRAVAFASDSEGWAVGGSSILHYQAGRWQTVAQAINADWRGVAAQGGAGFAVGGTLEAPATFRIVQLGSQLINVNPLPRLALNAVAYASPRGSYTSSPDAWAVGDGGNVLQYKGSWQPVVIPTYANLNAVYFLDPSAGWVVGSGGTILQYVNGNWATFASPTNAPLTGVGFTSTGDGWAIGYGTILHFTGGAWQKVSQ